MEFGKRHDTTDTADFFPRQLVADLILGNWCNGFWPLLTYLLMYRCAGRRLAWTPVPDDIRLLQTAAVQACRHRQDAIPSPVSARQRVSSTRRTLAVSTKVSGLRSSLFTDGPVLRIAVAALSAGPSHVLRRSSPAFWLGCSPLPACSLSHHRRNITYDDHTGLPSFGIRQLLPMGPPKHSLL